MAESIMVERDVSAGRTDEGPRAHRAHERARVAARRPGRQGARRARDVRGDAASLLADRRVARAERRLRHEHEDEPAAPRAGADREAMLEGLRDGSIDAIATDHAPHHADEKALEFDRAPFGIVGLETAVSLCFDRLVHAGVIGLSRMVELLSTNPARLLKRAGRHAGRRRARPTSRSSRPTSSVTVTRPSSCRNRRTRRSTAGRSRARVAATIVGGGRCRGTWIGADGKRLTANGARCGVRRAGRAECECD